MCRKEASDPPRFKALVENCFRSSSFAFSASGLSCLTSSGPSLSRLLSSRPSRESPKSVSLMCPSLPISTLSGLRSRWTMFIVCRYSRASTISAMYCRDTVLSRKPRLHRSEYMSPPGRYSITRNNLFADWKDQKKRTMKGFATPARMSFSARTRATRFFRIMSLLLSVFTAKISPVDFLRARYTLPNAPREIGLRISKSLMFGSKRSRPMSIDLRTGEFCREAALMTVFNRLVAFETSASCGPSPSSASATASFLALSGMFSQLSLQRFT
mmetsp:Transcript_1178/g.3645  ORF Transcript_1178/g.3645 Transcript_1178/m.3645 type:complete len:271 (+) Transcript_1178:1015-1827(+)